MLDGIFRCPDNCPRRKLPPPRLGLGFGLVLTLGLGLGGDFALGQLAKNRFLLMFYQIYITGLSLVGITKRISLPS